MMMRKKKTMLVVLISLTMNSLFSDYVAGLSTLIVSVNMVKNIWFRRTTVECLILPFQKRKLLIFGRFSKLKISEVPLQITDKI